MLADLSAPVRQQRILKSHSLMAVFRQLCARPGLSRSDLAAALQLTRSTVGVLVRELIDDGWLAESGAMSPRVFGRRPAPLSIDATRLVLLGADVGADGVRVVATALTGKVLAREHVACGRARGVQACITGLIEALLAVCAQLDGRRQRIIGIGVGLPGVVDPASGRLRCAAKPDWHDVAFADQVATRLAGSALAGVPLFVQNLADAAAIGELEFNGADGAAPLLFLSIDRGVEAGVVVDGRLLRGRNGFAGDVGHMVLHLEGPECVCGRRGCADVLLGVGELLAQNAAESVAELRRRLGEGDVGAVQSVRQAGTALGVLMHNLTCAFDPVRIVLGGAMADLGNALLEPALAALRDHASPAGASLPDVGVSRFGEDAVAVGAAAVVRCQLTRPSPVLVAPALPPGAETGRPRVGPPQQFRFFSQNDLPGDHSCKGTEAAVDEPQPA